MSIEDYEHRRRMLKLESLKRIDEINKNCDNQIAILHGSLFGLIFLAAAAYAVSTIWSWI